MTSQNVDANSDQPSPEDLIDEHQLHGDALAKAVILAESVERTEHPEETGAASSQTIPDITTPAE